MFYRPGVDSHGLNFNPFKAMISPRPIAWISTIDVNGRANLAPYSFFNAFADNPPMVAYGSGKSKLGSDEDKDTLTNVRETGEFVVNIVSAAMKEAMNATSAHLPSGADEFERCGIEKAGSTTVSAPRVAVAPASLECKLWKILDLPGGINFMVIGEVTGVHYNTDFVKNGRFDVEKYQPVARLGYRDFCTVTSVFELDRPDDPA